MEQQRAWSPRTVWVPREHKVPFGTAFRTSDGEVYRRDGLTSVVRRVTPKVRGKAARRADKVARQKARHVVSGKKAA